MVLKEGVSHEESQPEKFLQEKPVLVSKVKLGSTYTVHQALYFSLDDKWGWLMQLVRSNNLAHSMSIEGFEAKLLYFRIAVIVKVWRLTCKRVSRKTNQFRNHIMAHVSIFFNSTTRFSFNPSKEYYFASSSIVVLIMLYHVSKNYDFFTFLVLYMYLFIISIL